MNAQRETVRRESRFTVYVLALRNLAHQKLRTGLSALAVALGVMMMVAADTIASAVRNAGAALDTAQNADIVGDVLAGGLTSVGLVILLAAGFLIFNAFAMSVTQRRRQIGLLRALGMTRRQVLTLLLVESLATGGAGALWGLLAGPLVGVGLLRLMGALGTPFLNGG